MTSECFVDAYNKRIEAAAKSEKIVYARDDLIELNAHFTGFLANLGMYLACVPRKISSNRSAILDVHTKATNVEYDSNFSYRLLTNIRNYTLHNSPPITGIKGSNKRTEDGSVKTNYDIYIEKSEIKEDEVIANKLATDFSNTEEHYPVIDNASRALESLSKIHWKTIKALVSEIGDSIGFINSIAQLTSWQNRQPYIAEFKAGKKSGVTDAELHFVPTHVLDIKEHADKY